MPSPVGHALGGMIAGWSVAPRATTPRQLVTQGLLLAVLGAAPDLDLLYGRHRVETHSLGAVVAVGVLAAVWRWPLAVDRVRIFLVACCAWGSHLLLDLLSTDRFEPSGIVAAWPFSAEYVHLANLFPRVERRWWVSGFLTGNLWALAVEVVVLLPLLLLVRRRRRPATRADDGTQGRGAERPSASSVNVDEE